MKFPSDFRPLKTYASLAVRQRRRAVVAPKTIFGTHMASTGFTLPVSPKLSAADNRM